MSSIANSKLIWAQNHLLLLLSWGPQFYLYTRKCEVWLLSSSRGSLYGNCTDQTWEWKQCKGNCDKIVSNKPYKNTHIDEQRHLYHYITLVNMQGQGYTGKLSHNHGVSKNSVLLINAFYVGMRAISWCILVYSIKHSASAYVGWRQLGDEHIIITWKLRQLNKVGIDTHKNETYILTTLYSKTISRCVLLCLQESWLFP